MALKCRSALAPRQRREISFWTSAAFLALGVAVVFYQEHLGGGLPSRGEGRGPGGVRREEAAGRRLEETEGSSLYPVDAILGTRPYKDAEPVRKIGIIVHIIGCCYMFLALNTVCDIYFTGALDIMVSVWNIKPDVAGATFMAAGGSAPEFFTSLIGCTIAVSDVGFGTIVGSAVFNVLFVIGACGFAAPGVLKLTWWPLFRDCTFYIVGLAVLASFAVDQQIQWWEALILFCLYLVYITIMYFNSFLEKKTDTAFMRRMTGQGLDDDKVSRITPITEDVEKGEKRKEGANLRKAATADSMPGPPEHHRGVLEEPGADPSEEKEESVNLAEGIPTLPSDEDDSKKGRSEDPKADGEEKTSNAEEEEEEEDAVEEMMTIPESGKWRYFWFVCCPVYILLYYGIPKPTEKRFFLTFSVSLLWIAGFAFCLVWWVEIVMGALWIDPIIQGLTVLAAGTSIPDMASSVAVTRKGYGDMAVSSSIGSNIFDILVGLPVPWMIKILLVEHDPNFTVTLFSEYLAFHTLVLMGMVFAVVLSIHCLGWRLNKTLGVMMGLLYFAFLIVAVSVEYLKPEALKF